MGKLRKKSLTDGRYLTYCAKDQGLRVEHKNGGSHANVYAPIDRGYMSIPQRELGKGLACAIRKWLVAAGITFTLVFAVWYFMPLFGG